MGTGRREQVPLHTYRHAGSFSPFGRFAFADLAIFSAPAVFVVLWASGFVGAKLGLPYTEPMTFLAIRMGAVVIVIGIVALITRPVWPSGKGVVHSIVTGLFVHGCYLGGVFFSIDHKLPAGLSALVVSLATGADLDAGEPVARRARGAAAVARPGARDRGRLSRGPRTHRRRGAVHRLAWCDGGADRHDHRHALPEAFRRRDRLASRCSSFNTHRPACCSRSSRSASKRGRCSGPGSS